MKVLHLIYTHGIAGAEKYLKHLLPPLKDKGISSHLVLVCSPGFENKLQEYCDDMCSRGIPSSVKVYSKKNFLSAAKSIAAYTKQHNIEVLHSHLVNSDILAILIRYLYNKKLKIVSTKHGYSEYVLKQIIDVNKLGSLKWKARLKPYYYVTWLTLKLIPHNFAVSRAMAQLYKNLGFTKKAMPYIHHGLNVQAPAGETLTNITGSPLLVIAGRLEIFKGHEYIFKAMPAVLKRFPHSKLLVLGEGGEKQYYENLCQTLGITNSVNFLGFQQNPYSYIRAAEVMVIPSLFEPFGLVFIEAIALQKAVVCFDVPAGNEILTNNETALMAARANYEELAANIILLLENDALRNGMAAKAYQLYSTKFITDVMVQKTLEYYQSLH